MERDFLSLSMRSSSVNVKDEVNDDSKHSALPDRSSGTQWSFSNKVSAVPQFLSFKGPQDNRPRKPIHDSLGSMTISCSDAFDTNHKTFSTSIPNQGGNHIPMTVYHPQETNIFPGNNQPIRAIPVGLSAPVFQSTLNNVAMKPHSFGGHPIISSMPVLPSNSSVVGTTDLRNTLKAPRSPAQLTIFYGGSVNVYDEITPEKAQAIMLLAGNESSPSQNKQASMAHVVEASAPRPAITEGFMRSWSFSGSVTMRPDSLSKEGSNNNGLAKTLGASGSSSNLQLPPETPRVAASVISSVAVPQARKASLARFLEKRKERVISASPYSVADKSSDVTSLSVNSSQRFDSSPLSSVN